jgi:hypothetical protein
MITKEQFELADGHTVALICSKCFALFECNILARCQVQGMDRIGWRILHDFTSPIKQCPYCGEPAES